MLQWLNTINTIHEYFGKKVFIAACVSHIIVFAYQANTPKRILFTINDLHAPNMPRVENKSQNCFLSLFPEEGNLGPSYFIP